METYLTIYVTFEGLGFCCFNSKSGRAEIAFLRLPKHTLKIVITGSDGSREVIENIEESDEIELVSQGTLIKGLRLNRFGAFDRKKGFDSENDPFDLRWLVDFEGDELHKQKVVPQNQQPDSVTGLTKMYLPNAYFFAEQLLDAEYNLLEISGGTTTHFGNVGDTLAAKVDAALAELQINGKSRFSFNKSITPDSVTRFLVNITNVCDSSSAPQTQSDFQKYYEVLNPQDNKKFDFEPVATSLSGPRPVMCDFVLLGKTEELDEFFPKPEE